MMSFRSLKNGINKRFFTLLRFTFFFSILLTISPITQAKSSFAIIHPSDQTWITDQSVPIKGLIKSGKLKSIFINGSQVPVSWQGQFSTQLPCKLGQNKIYFHGISESFNTLIKTKKTVYCLKPYSDITNHWAEKEIRLFTTLTNVPSWGTQFKPDQPITREELMHYIVQGHQLPLNHSKKALFRDVLPKNPSFDTINTAVLTFNITGISQTDFAPKGWVSRAELSKILVKITKTPLLKNPESMASDVPSYLWATPYLMTAKSVNLFPPHWSQEKLYPYRPITRSEAIYALVHTPKIKEKINIFFNGQIPWNKPFTAWNTPSPTPKKTNEKHKVRRIKPIRQVPESKITLPKPKIMAAQSQTAKPKKETQVIVYYDPYQSTKKLIQKKIQAFEQRKVVTQQRNIEIKKKETPPFLTSLFKSIKEIKVQPKIVRSSPPKKAKPKKQTPPKPREKKPAKTPKTVPHAPQKQSSQAEIFYTIKKGDTLPRIAKRFTGASRNWKKIAEENGLKIIALKRKDKIIYSCTIIPGRTLRIQPHDNYRQ